MSRIPKELLNAYKRTDFIFYPQDDISIIKIGKNNKKLDKILSLLEISSALFITAWNPYSKQMTPSANKKNQNRLIRMLKKQGTKFSFGSGRSEDLKFHEDSILAYGCSRKEAASLGKQFHQNAVVFYEKGKAAKLLLLK